MLFSLRRDAGNIGLEPVIAVREVPPVDLSNLGKIVVISVVRMDGLVLSRRRHDGGGSLQSCGEIS